MIFLRLLFRELAAQKMRLALTTCAVAWGTLSITLLLAFGEGLEKQMIRGTRGLGENIVIMGGGQTGRPHAGLPAGRRISLTMEDMVLMRAAFPEITSITAEYNTWGATVGYKDKDFSAPLSGTTPEFGPMRNHIPVAGGRFINEVDERLRRRVAFVGDKLAGEIFGAKDPVGEIITINGKPFTVIGVMQKKQQNNMYMGPDNNKLTIPAATYETMFGERYVRRFIYQMQKGLTSPDLEPRVLAFFGSRLNFQADDDRALWFWDVGENERTTRMVFLGVQGFMFFIGAMTLLISGVGIANIMYVAVRERTREIGTKMALGGERWHIVWQFLLEALSMALVGGVLGMIFSAGIIKGLGYLPPAMFSDLFGQPEITWFWTLLTVLILAVIGFFAGYFPARKAASVNPVEALRYE